MELSLAIAEEHVVGLQVTMMMSLRCAASTAAKIWPKHSAAIRGGSGPLLSTPVNVSPLIKSMTTKTRRSSSSLKSYTLTMFGWSSAEIILASRFARDTSSSYSS